MRIELTPIGVMRTPFKSKYDAPRQPGITQTSQTSHIDLLPHHNFEQALDDLDGFDRIWIVSWFDRVGGWKPKVLPPRSYGKRGVFATRSPHRPNPIGLSVARLVAIQGLRITVEDSDLLDGTPILDIKPYVPYVDAHPDSADGWLSKDARLVQHEVVYSTNAFDGLDEDAAERIRLHVERTIAIDPLPHPYRRTKHISESDYVMAIRHMRVFYTIAENVILVTKVVELPLVE